MSQPLSNPTICIAIGFDHFPLSKADQMKLLKAGYKLVKPLVQEITYELLLGTNGIKGSGQVPSQAYLLDVLMDFEAEPDYVVQNPVWNIPTLCLESSKHLCEAGYNLFTEEYFDRSGRIEICQWLPGSDMAFTGKCAELNGRELSNITHQEADEAWRIILEDDKNLRLL